jgi:hypothetical protein
LRSIGAAPGLGGSEGIIEESIVKGIGEAIPMHIAAWSPFSSSFSPSTDINQYRIMRQLIPDTQSLNEHDGEKLRSLCTFFR